MTCCQSPEFTYLLSLFAQLNNCLVYKMSEKYENLQNLEAGIVENVTTTTMNPLLKHFLSKSSVNRSIILALV